jgi:hypothetical protein
MKMSASLTLVLGAVTIAACGESAQDEAKADV